MGFSESISFVLSGYIFHLESQWEKFNSVYNVLKITSLEYIYLAN